MDNQEVIRKKGRPNNIHTPISILLKKRGKTLHNDPKRNTCSQSHGIVSFALTIIN